MKMIPRRESRHSYIADDVTLPYPGPDHHVALEGAQVRVPRYPPLRLTDFNGVAEAPFPAAMDHHAVGGRQNQIATYYG